MKPSSGRALRALATYAFPVAFLVPAAARAAEIGSVCVRNYAAGITCEGNDVWISRIQPVNILEDCASGDPTSAQATFRVWVSSGPSGRYDAGLFLALDGGSALSGGNCLHDYLEPPLATSPIYGDFDGNGRPDLLGGPWWNGEPFAVPEDTCGDVQGNTDSAKTLSFRVACVDSTLDGIVDVSTCTSWSSGTSSRCDRLADAFPSTAPRCGCAVVETGIPMPPGAQPAGRIAGLTLQRLASGDLHLSWAASCSGGDTDHGIYEGTLGQFASHQTVVCTTGGATSATIAPTAGGRYYLVVPRNALREGSYGKNSAGVERSPAAAACLPQAVHSPCP